MDIKRKYYTTIGGVRKNLKLLYYLRGIMLMATPHWWCSLRARMLLDKAIKREDWNVIDSRAQYYMCLANNSTQLPEGSPTLSQNTLRKPRLVNNSVYFFDTFEFTRCFNQKLRWQVKTGDVNVNLVVPSICKSRPVLNPDKGTCNVLLNMDKVRHFTFINDPFPWCDKESKVLFRGDANGKPHRIKFIEMWADNDKCDLKVTDRKSVLSEKWHAKSPLAIYDHLKYRYIMALEGNDVASNLKWVMSSNSIAVMPRPKFETWYMEGQLKPDYHYIEIADDYHDLLERIAYYDAHPKEAEAIIQHAHEWVSQFMDKERETMISLLVMQRYLDATNGITNKTDNK